MIDTWIARFAHRDSGSYRLTRWHYVESEIENRAVTRCGRELATNPKTSLITSAVVPGALPNVADRCLYCDRG